MRFSCGKRHEKIEETLAVERGTRSRRGECRAMEEAGAEGRGGGGGGGSSTSGGGGNGGVEKQVVAAAEGQAPSKKQAAPREGKEEREVGEEEHQLVPTIPYTVPAPLGRNARSYTVLDLNGTKIEVRDRWRRSVLDYRLWCYNNSDKRYEFGHQHRRCCTLPSEGHFLIYMHYKTKWLCAVIDGPSGYLYGYITRSVGKTNQVRIRENLEKQKYIEHAKRLPWDGGYECAQITRCGDLITSFITMHRYVEEEEDAPPPEQVKRAGETFILHFTEAAKSDKLYLGILFRNFRAGNMVGGRPILDARRWKIFCGVVYSALGTKEEEFDDDQKKIKYVVKNKSMTTEDSSRKRMTTVKSVIEAKKTLTDLRLMYRPNNRSGYLLLKNMPMQLTKDGPLDPLWAEHELKESHKLDLDNENWGFLIERFIGFSSTNIDGSTRKLLHNAYMSTDDLMGDELVAYHESGHAIVALHTAGAHPIHMVTIVPQGSSLGMVSQVAAVDNVPISKKQILARLDVCLGGRIAQELVFGEQNVIKGAEQDLVTARGLAQNMVSNYRMSGTADPMQVEESPSSVEAEVTRLLGESYERVKLLLKKHVNQLEAVANALLEKETLTVDEILKIVDQCEPYHAEVENHSEAVAFHET